MLCYNASYSAAATGASVDPRESYASSLALYQLYIYASIPAVVSNAVCIAVFLSRQELRSKYPMFVTLTIGDLLTGLGSLLAGVYRTRLILDNDYNKRTSFECLRNSWPHFYIIGGQISAFIMLLMGIERIMAVYKPLFYKKHATVRLRLIVIGCCVLAAFVSLLIGYLCSYLNSDQCVIATCSILNTTGRLYSDYNSIVIIGFPIFALILNIMTFVGAKKSISNASTLAEWHKVLLTLTICTCSVLLIAVPNFLLWGYRRYWSPVFMPYLFIAFCCYSTINLFVYFIMKADFRRQLIFMLTLSIISIADTTDNKAETRSIQIQPKVSTRGVTERNQPSAANSLSFLSASFSVSGLLPRSAQV
uniref:G-protein coupled receptors family 1 profile domain-containing protein n=1 Tax=Plectus sambesii TaxID=2011161 RepID=A0A914X1Y8_9BILA